MRSGATIIFSGPSLLRTDRCDTRFEFRPPAIQGDILRAIQEKPAAIGLIDGYFGSVLSVHQKEILEALSEGIPVFGAASMGALRAAELAPFGMIGVGGIFRDYVSGRLDSDADVAIAHGPQSLDFMATSISLVDLRATLEKLNLDGGFDPDELRVVLDQSVALHFAERGWEQIGSSCAQIRAMSFDVAAVLKARLVQRKRGDALELLDRLAHSIDPVKSRTERPCTAAYLEIRQRALAGP